MKKAETSFLSTSAVLRKSSSFESYRGYTWAKPESSDLDIPVLALDGRSFYPVPFPVSDMAPLYRRLWQILVVEGKVLKSAELRKLLVSRSTEGAPIKLGDEEMRHQLREFGILLRLPLIATVPVGDSTGFGIARNRKQIVEYQKNLASRVEKFQEAGRSLVKSWPFKSGVSKFSIEDWEPSESVASKNPKLKELLRRMRDGAVKNAEVRSILDEDWAESQVRPLIHQLRVEGVPICGGNSGYWLAETPEDLNGWLKTQKSRGDAVEERIEAINQAGLFWYPKEDELDQARSLRTQPHSYKASKVAEARAAKKLAGIEKRSEERQLRDQADREIAKEYLDQLKAKGLEDAEHRVGYGLSPSKEDLRIVSEAKLVRRFLKTGEIPRRKRGESKGVWEPERRRRKK